MYLLHNSCASLKQYPPHKMMVVVRFINLQVDLLIVANLIDFMILDSGIFHILMSNLMLTSM